MWDSGGQSQELEAAMPRLIDVDRELDRLQGADAEDRRRYAIHLTRDQAIALIESCIRTGLQPTARLEEILAAVLR